MGKYANERLYTETAVLRLIATATHPLLDRIEQFEVQIARMGKDSSHSSQPPSSDIVKPKSTQSKGNKKAGGQTGHPRHVRESFPPDQVDRSYVYELEYTTSLEPLEGSE